MTNTPIFIPAYAALKVTRLRCRHCDHPLRPTHVIAAGVRRRSSGGCAFAVTVRCERCGKRTRSCMSKRPLDPTYWAGQIFAVTPTPAAARPDTKPKPVETPAAAEEGQWSDEAPEERPEYYALPVVVLNYTPGNYDHAAGDPASILTIAKRDMSIESLVFTMSDTKRLVARALVTLATYHDPLAEKLLDDCFEGDDDGNFVWPAQPPPDWA